MLSAKSPQSLFNCFYKFNASLKAPLLCKVLLCTLGLDQSPPRAQHKFGIQKACWLYFQVFQRCFFCSSGSRSPPARLAPGCSPRTAAGGVPCQHVASAQAATWTAPGRPAVGQSHTSQTPLTSASFPGRCPRSAQVPVLSDRS